MLFLLGLFASSFIAIFAGKKQLLTDSGVIATIVLGTVTCTIAPWPTWGLWILFFGSSVAIHLFKKIIDFTELDSFAEKGAVRDGFQILANSLPALLCLVGFAITQSDLFLIAFAAGVAGAAADTWASEIGVLSPTPPRSILTGKILPKGKSGGITLLGTCASLCGAGMIAAAYWVGFSLLQRQLISLKGPIIILLSGTLDSVFDSLLGAGLQASFQCRVCGRLTEKSVHHQQSTELVHGLRWFTNDWVNLVSGGLTVLLSLGLIKLFL